MQVEQISVFLENKSGRLHELVKTLGAEKINIRALSLADTLDFGVVRIIVDDVQKTKKVLKDAGFTVGVNEVLAVLIKDEPGGLASVLSVLSENGLDVEYMYAFVGRQAENAVMIFRFENTEKALDLLKSSKGFEVLSAESVYQM